MKKETSVKKQNLDITEVEPIGFNAKFFNQVQKDYRVSRGKSKLLRKSFLLVLLGMIISLLAINFLPEVLPENLTWLGPILWLPRLAAIFFIILALLRAKDFSRIKPFMTFTKNGIIIGAVLVSWEDITGVKVEYTISDDEQFDLKIYTKNDEKCVDLRNVDEFSEDVAVVLTKYLKKYSYLKSEEGKD